MMAGLVIEVKNLCTKRGGQTIHRDLDMQIGAGEIIGLVGAPAAAKPRCCASSSGLMRRRAEP